MNDQNEESEWYKKEIKQTKANAKLVRFALFISVISFLVAVINLMIKICKWNKQS